MVLSSERKVKSKVTYSQNVENLKCAQHAHQMMAKTNFYLQHSRTELRTFQDGLFRTFRTFYTSQIKPISTSIPPQIIPCNIQPMSVSMLSCLCFWLQHQQTFLRTVHPAPKFYVCADLLDCTCGNLRISPVFSSSHT